MQGLRQAGDGFVENAGAAAGIEIGGERTAHRGDRDLDRFDAHRGDRLGLFEGDRLARQAPAPLQRRFELALARGRGAFGFGVGMGNDVGGLFQRVALLLLIFGERALGVVRRRLTSSSSALILAARWSSAPSISGDAFHAKKPKAIKNAMRTQNSGSREEEHHARSRITSSTAARACATSSSAPAIFKAAARATSTATSRRWASASALGRGDAPLGGGGLGGERLGELALALGGGLR